MKIRDMEAHKIYFIVGASKLQAIKITLMYSCLLSAIAVLFYIAANYVAIQIPWPQSLAQIKAAYYSTAQNNLLIIFLVIIPVLFISFVIPFVFIRRQSEIDLYKTL
jgi:hypothetical protein